LSEQFDPFTKDNSVFIIGAGGHGRVICDAVGETNATVSFNSQLHIYFVDDNPCRFPDCSLDEVPSQSKVLVGIGDNYDREKVVHRLKSSGKPLIFSAVKHPSSSVSRNVAVGFGAVVFAKAAINTDAILGDFCIINTGATVDHDCVIGDFAHIAPGVNLCGNVKVGDRTLIGVGSCVRPEITIGSDTIIGAGSVVVSNIPSGVVAHGNPCRVIKEIE
jgi:sugar O-acyltransferase (sialic acid O-acetyltransferase NeuD family)